MTPLNRLAAVVLMPLSGLAWAPALAEADIALSSDARTGWTSNAGANPQERASGFVEQSTTLRGTLSGRTYSLRGSIGLEGTHYFAVPEESDRTLSGAVHAAFAPGHGWTLRGGFEIEHSDEGTLLEVAGIPLGVRSPRTRATTEVAATRHWGDTALTVTLGHRADRPWGSTFADPSVPRQRLDPITSLFSGSASLAHALSPALAVTARAEARQLVVGAIDQALYGRRPARRLTLAPGLEVATERGLSFALEAGADTLVADALPQGVGLYPYAALDARLPLTQTLALTAAADAGLDLSDPADGLADYSLEGRFGVDLDVWSAGRISAEVFARQTRATLVTAVAGRETGARAALDIALTDGLDLSATLDHSHTREGGAEYGETRLGVGLYGRL